jgi:hypothetical protein
VLGISVGDESETVARRTPKLSFRAREENKWGQKFFLGGNGPRNPKNAIKMHDFGPGPFFLFGAEGARDGNGYLTGPCDPCQLWAGWGEGPDTPYHH